MKIKIRKVNKKDISQIWKIFRVQYAKKPYNERWTKNSYEKWIMPRFKKSLIYVAEFNKQVIGYIIFTSYFYNDGMRGFIEDFGVLDKFHGRGIGKRLIKKAESELKGKGIKKIILGTLQNSPAVKFYKKRGYKEMKIRWFMKKSR